MCGIIKELQAQRPMNGNDVEYWRNMVVKFAPFTKKDLLVILQKKSFYEGEMERLARRPGAQVRQKKQTLQSLPCAFEEMRQLRADACAFD